MELSVRPRRVDLARHVEVQVAWECDAVHTDWTPKETDEVRVYGSGGVVVAHRMLADGLTGRVDLDAEGVMVPASMRTGTCPLPVPAHPGEYVVCVYDFAAKCRMSTIPFTVEGRAKGGGVLAIEVSQQQVAPYGRLDFRLPEGVAGGYLAMFREGSGDNDGLNGRNEHYFASAALVLNTEACTLRVPDVEGAYHLRYLRKPVRGLPECLAASPPFHVARDPAIPVPVVPVIEGVIRVLTDVVLAGTRFEIEWDFANGGYWMDCLDSFLLFSYGKPETVKPGDQPCNTLLVPNYSGRIFLEAPQEAGTYEVGYFSHREQKVLCFGDAVQVQPLKVALAVPLVTPVNEEFAFSWETATAIDASEDRFRIYTDDMSLFGSGPIQRGAARQQPAAGGTVRVAVNRPGTFIMTYWSAALDAEVGQSKPFDIEGASEVAALQVNFLCPRAIPFGRPFEVEFDVTGDDLRPPAESMNDTIGLYHHEDRDFVETAYFDDVVRCQALQVLPIRGERGGVLRFQPPPLPGTYHLRYLTDTRLLCQATVFRCVFDVVEDSLVQSQSQGAKSQVFRYQSTANLALAPQERTTLEDLLSPAAAPLSTRSSGSQSATMTANPDLFNYFNPETDFSGSLITPKMVTVRSSVVVTYHLTSGSPLPTDMIMLLDNERRDRIYASVELVDAVGRPDLSLGSLMLRAPDKVGLFIAAYFSTRYGALVLASPTFKVVSAVDDPTGGQRADGKLVLPFGTTTQDAEAARAAMNGRPLASLPEEMPSLGSSVKVVLCGLLYVNTFHELQGCVNDCHALAQVLHQAHRVPTSNLLLLTEGGPPGRQPTAALLRKALRWLVQDAQRGSRLFFFYSGHGSFVNGMSGDPAVGADECIVPLDNDWGLRCISFGELWRTLYQPLPAGATMTSLMDCGHVPSLRDLQVHRHGTHDPAPKVAKLIDRIVAQRAAQGVDPEFRVKAVAPPPFMFHTLDNCHFISRSTFHSLFHPESGAEPSLGTPTACMNFVRACRRGQMCHDTFIAGRYRGVFAWAAHKVLVDFKSVTLDEFLRLTTRYIQTLGYVQHPQLFVSSDENLQFPLL